MAAPIYKGGAPFFKPFLRFPHNVYLPIELPAGGAPVSGASGTGNGKAGPGSLYVDWLTGTWYVNVGTQAVPQWLPYTGGVTTNITAFAGGGQTNATQLKPGVDIVTVVATAGDSVKLPPAVAGMEVLVINATGGSTQQSPVLLTAASYGILANSTVTNTGSTVVTGFLGLSPGTSVTGFPPGTSGPVHVADAAAAQAQTDATAAVATLNAVAVTQDLSGQDLGGMVLGPGKYNFSTSAAITGTLTLDGQNNPAAQFIFKTGTTLGPANASVVKLINGAKAGNVFWVVGSAATIGTTAQFVGTIIAGTSITVNTGAVVVGRLIAQTAAVTISGASTITTAESSGNAMQVFGSGTDTINGIASATGVSQAAGTSGLYIATSSGPGGTWIVSFTALAGAPAAPIVPPAPTQPAQLLVNAAIDPTTSFTYVITKASAEADTLAAPANPGGNGVVITITSDTAFAHTVTFTGSTLDSGAAAALTATFNAFKGSSLTVMAFNGRWKVISANGVAFS